MFHKVSNLNVYSKLHRIFCFFTSFSFQNHRSQYNELRQSNKVQSDWFKFQDSSWSKLKIIYIHQQCLIRCQYNQYWHDAKLNTYFKLYTNLSSYILSILRAEFFAFFHFCSIYQINTNTKMKSKVRNMHFGWKNQLSEIHQRSHIK